MDANAMVGFSQAVWIFLSAAAQHWLMTIAVLFLTAYMSFNVWMVAKMYGSVAGMFREDGLKKGLVLLFFGLPMAIWGFIILFSPDDDDEEYQA